MARCLFFLKLWNNEAATEFRTVIHISCSRRDMNECIINSLFSLSKLCICIPYLLRVGWVLWKRIYVLRSNTTCKSIFIALSQCTVNYIKATFQNAIFTRRQLNGSYSIVLRFRPCDFLKTIHSNDLSRSFYS